METAETTTKQVTPKEKNKKEKKDKKKEVLKKEKEKKPPTVKFEIPPEKRCRGTCVTGFFSLLCDEIDRSAICPGSGRCCITRAPPRPRPQDKKDKPPPRTPRPPVRPPRPPPPPKSSSSKCPGVCIPNVMLGLCE